MPFIGVLEAIEEIRAGRILVVVDDEDREYEGDLTIAAEKVTPEVINFMAKHARGLVCAPVTEQCAKRLGLAEMVQRNREAFSTRFTVSVSSSSTSGELDIE